MFCKPLRLQNLCMSNRATARHAQHDISGASETAGKQQGKDRPPRRRRSEQLMIVKLNDLGHLGCLGSCGAGSCGAGSCVSGPRTIGGTVRRALTAKLTQQRVDLFAIEANGLLCKPTNPLGEAHFLQEDFGAPVFVEDTPDIEPSFGGVLIALRVSVSHGYEADLRTMLGDPILCLANRQRVWHAELSFSLRHGDLDFKRFSPFLPPLRKCHKPPK
jgi:hypothetical protein